LVVGQFGSFNVPLMMLTSVLLTLMGIMFGHWLFGAPFSATSMIGSIVVAGIIVRNSILLVDFICKEQKTGAALRDVLIQAGAVGFKPILLTAAAAMIGAAFNFGGCDLSRLGNIHGVWFGQFDRIDGIGNPRNLYCVAR